jgi:chromodomain-helicase-DNA-binding protein 1
MKLISSSIAGSPSQMSEMDSASPSEQVNGHEYPRDDGLSLNGGDLDDSGSDLSDVRDPPVVEASPSPSSSANQQSDFENDDAQPSESSEDENNASDDADFEKDDSAAETAPNHSTKRSNSHDSRRQAKRRLGIEDDEYVKANPELYGLRRSVCF